MRTSFLLACAVPLAVTAQNDYFANDPVWRVGSLCNNGGGIGGSCMSDKTYNYFLSGDTLANGYTYKKVMRQGMETVYWQGGNPPPPPMCTGTTQFGPELVALLRQDGLAIFEWQEDMEVLVYDFDLNTGDTLPLSTTNWNPDITVGAIDSVLVGTEWRKRFALINSWAPYLVEGVGSSHGLLEPVSNFFDCGYELDCYGLGSTGYYPGQGPDCHMVMGLTAAQERPARFQVFPNPATSRITVVSDRSLGTLRLFDAQGREVIVHTTNSMATGIDLGGLGSGMYVLANATERRMLSIMR